MGGICVICGKPATKHLYIEGERDEGYCKYHAEAIGGWLVQGEKGER